MLKLQNEQWFLFAVLVIGGGLLVFRAIGLAPLEDQTSRAGKTPPAFDPKPYQEAAQKFLNPPEVKDGVHKVFLSRLVVYYPKEETVKALNPLEKGPDKITVQWKIENNFPIDDPSVAAADTDKDGFSNFEEFEAKTAPRDPESRPSLIFKLRVEKFTQVSFRVKLQGYNPDPANPGQMLYQLSLLDVAKNKTRIVKEGDMVEGYKVGAFRKKIVTRENPRTGAKEEIDESELDMINQRMGEVVTLVRNKEIPSDESFVQLQVDSPRGKAEPSRVVRGDKFKLDGKEYQLVQPGAKTITIKDLASGEILKDIGG